MRTHAASLTQAVLKTCNLCITRLREDDTNINIQIVHYIIKRSLQQLSKCSNIILDIKINDK